jgi:hypothetical protein
MLMGLGTVALLAQFASEVRGAAKAVKFTKEWTGSVADATLQQKAPKVITSGEELKKLWKAWGIKDKVPDVDFTKEIMVVETTRGSRLRLGARLNEKGDLQVLGLATRDLRDGFRYVIATVPRQGIKSVNGKAIQKD